MGGRPVRSQLPRILTALFLPGLVLGAEAPIEVVRLNEQGIARLLKGRAPHAITAFEAALDRQPGSRVLQRNLAAALAALAGQRRAAHRLNAAVALLDRAIRLHPERLRYRVLRGRARFEAGDGRFLQAALEDFEHVLARDPDHLDALVNAGQALYLERRLEKALGYWMRAQGLRPGDPDISARISKARREFVVEQRFEEVRGNRFSVRHSPRIPRRLAEAALTIFETAYSELGPRFGVYPDEVKVTLYAPGEFRSATRAHRWVGGLSDGTIRLSVRPLDTPGRLRPTIYHEYTHHLVRSIAPRAPVWLHEGLAQISEGRSLPAAEARLRAADRLEPGALSTPIIAVRDPRRVGLLYDLALCFTRHLVRLGGDAGMSNLLRLLKDRKDELVAIRTVYGRLRHELFDEWQQRLRGR